MTDLAPPRSPGVAVPIEVLVAATFLGAAAFALAGGGAVVRLLFPAAAMLLSAWLLRSGRREDYLALVIWLFLLTPGLRRVVDLYAGWAQINILMLAPYAAAALCVGPLLASPHRRGYAYGGLFAIVLACVGYGLTVAIANDRLSAAIFDTLRWGVPPCFALFIALDPGRLGGHRAALTRTMLQGLIVTGLYGTYQFLQVPAWDAMWMRESGLLSIGLPEPYLIRVFSTMNSPGSYANYLMAGLLLALPAAGMLRLPAVLLGTLAFLLTLVRTSWLGFGVGLLFLVLFGASARSRFSILIGVVCLPLVLGILQQVPEGAEIIDQRLSSLVGVQDDGSYVERSAGYRDFLLIDLPEAPFGSGLGASGSYQGYLGGRTPRIVDGALIEIGLALGVVAGGIYLLAILATGLLACWSTLGRGDTFLSSCAAIVAAQIVTLSGGMTVVGESGMMFWVPVGFCLMASRAGVAAPAPRVRRDPRGLRSS